MRAIEKIIENLEFLISEDCTDTQFDYVDDIENAVEIIKKIQITGIDINRLTEICDAEREGRLVVLPCKVGGIAYILDYKCSYGWTEDINCGFCDIGVYDDKDVCDKELVIREIIIDDLSDLTSKVYLTKEQAEKALVERNET